MGDDFGQDSGVMPLDLLARHEDVIAAAMIRAGLCAARGLALSTGCAASAAGTHRPAALCKCDPPAICAKPHIPHGQTRPLAACAGAADSEGGDLD